MADTEPPDGEDWLYHVPQFLDQLREKGAESILDSLDIDLGGVFYHHRGVRMPAYNATFIWREDENVFELELDAVGPRGIWATFDADREWDFFLSRPPQEQPCLAWMCDDEFYAEEADEFGSKMEAVGLGRFSFGLYLHSPATWEELEERARNTTAPCFIYRPSGRTLVPDEQGTLEDYADALPQELRPNEEEPPDYLGLVDAELDYDRDSSS